jgi:hypothetical protein
MDKMPHLIKNVHSWNFHGQRQGALFHCDSSFIFCTLRLLNCTSKKVHTVYVVLADRKVYASIILCGSQARKHPIEMIRNSQIFRLAFTKHIRNSP